MLKEFSTKKLLGLKKFNESYMKEEKWEKLLHTLLTLFYSWITT